MPHRIPSRNEISTTDETEKIAGIRRRHISGKPQVGIT
nr:hypothetical protein JVH1_4269 [Rhodococcus sp. JVH1]